MKYPDGTAAVNGWGVCHVCNTVADLTHHMHQSQPQRHLHRCALCKAVVHLRKPESLQRCLAYLATAVLLYLPANLLPIMETQQLSRVSANTIAGGVVLLWHHGSYPIALIIFIASVLVPLLKMLSIASLCWLVKRPGQFSSSQLARMLEITELVGKWSMVDVFVVALLVALVQVGGLLSIKPGSAALAFAGVVLCTMLSARAFDTKLIWDLEVTRDRLE